MKVMRDRLIEIVAGLSLRRSMSQSAAGSSFVSTPRSSYPRMKRNISASA